MSDVAEIQFDFRLDKLSGSQLTFQLPQNPIIKTIKGGGGFSFIAVQITRQDSRSRLS